MPVDLVTELTQGRKINIQPFFDQMPPSPRYRPDDPKLFSQVGDRVYHLDLAPGQTVGGKARPVAGSVKPGPGPNPVLKFKWLPFVPGSITYTAFNGTLPILTGKMSGCWLATFQLRGQTYLGHIGSDSNSVANTEDVKNAWKIAANARLILPPFRCFNPADHIANGMADFGAITARGDLYGISFDIDPTAPTIYSVKQVRHVPSPLPAPNFR